MAIGPSVSTNIRSINFPICTTASTIMYTEAPLAQNSAATNYVYGQLLAQITNSALPTYGYFINYVHGAADGQGVFVGVLMDDLFQSDVTGFVQGPVQIAVDLINGAYVYSQLTTTVPGDLDLAISQRNAKVIFDFFQGYPVNSSGIPTFPASTPTKLIYGL